MKHLATASTAILLLLFLAAAGLAEPQLTIPETEFDFGYVPQHSKIAHVFWLHSTGEDTLRIVKVSPG
jgi:hypothetical protein